MNSNMFELENAREAIVDIDRKMAALFEKRMDAVSRVAEYKREHGLRVEDTTREQILLAKNCLEIKNEKYKP